MKMQHGWLPHELQDEVVPPVRETPDAWIISLSDGAPALAYDNFYGGDDTPPGRLLRDGEIVEFDEFQDYGGGTLTVNPDGTFTADPPMPAQANCVRTDLENVTDSIEHLVAHGGPGLDCPLEPGEHDLDFYHWSDVPGRFRFDAATRSFVRLSDTPTNKQ